MEEDQNIDERAIYDQNRVYKYCLVPRCKNTIATAPDKVYFLVPRDEKIRNKWCKAMRRDKVSPTSCLYCCEDHFDIEKDTKNYIHYKIMALQEGQKTTLRLKKGVVPHIFQCQKDNEPPVERKSALKRKQKELVEEALFQHDVKKCMNDLGTGESSQISSKVSPSTCSLYMDIVNTDNQLFEAVSCTSSSNVSSKGVLQVDKAIQVNSKVQYRSKGVNVHLTTKKNTIALSPCLALSKNASTSPLKSAQISGTERLIISTGKTYHLPSA